MRWIVSIVLCAAFVAGSVMFLQSWTDLQAGKVQIEALAKEQSDLEQVAGMYEKQAEQALVVNALWDEIQEEGLDPNNWIEYPLSVNRTVAWPDLDRLLLLASNQLETSGYWFKPVQLRVERVIVATENAGNETDEAAADIGQQTEMMYEMTLDGSFMIPKE